MGALSIHPRDSRASLSSRFQNVLPYPHRGATTYVLFLRVSTVSCFRFARKNAGDLACQVSHVDAVSQECRGVAVLYRPPHLLLITLTYLGALERAVLKITRMRWCGGSARVIKLAVRPLEGIDATNVLFWEQTVD